MSLAGMRVALLEGRRVGELAEVVRRRGGEPWCVPSVAEALRPAADEVLALVGELEAEDEPVVILSTGVGVAALFEEADALGLVAPLRRALARATTVCRGPKPAAALHREHVEASVRVREPYTTAEVLEAVSPLDVEGRYALVLHHGERNLPLVEELLGRMARVRELLLYEWRLPDDTGPLRQLVRAIVEARVDAVAFTSQVQVRHLLQIASEERQLEALIRALRGRTLVAAVGPTCAAALQAHGVAPQVVPERPKMGAMVSGMAELVARGGRRA